MFRKSIYLFLCKVMVLIIVQTYIINAQDNQGRPQSVFYPMSAIHSHYAMHDAIINHFIIDRKNIYDFSTNHILPYEIDMGIKLYSNLLLSFDGVEYFITDITLGLKNIMQGYYSNSNILEVYTDYQINDFKFGISLFGLHYNIDSNANTNDQKSTTEANYLIDAILGPYVTYYFNDIFHFSTFNGIKFNAYNGTLPDSVAKLIDKYGFINHNNLSFSLITSDDFIWNTNISSTFNFDYLSNSADYLLSLIVELRSGFQSIVSDKWKYSLSGIINYFLNDITINRQIFMAYPVSTASILSDNWEPLSFNSEPQASWARLSIGLASEFEYYTKNEILLTSFIKFQSSLYQMNFMVGFAVDV